MKKSSTRTVLFCLLLALCSLGSYVYLSSLSSQDVPFGTTEVENYDDELESNDADIILPDIHFVKKVIETGKRLIPAS